MNLDSLYKSKASLGRFGDTELRVVNNELSHVNAVEADIIDNYGNVGEEFVQNAGSGTINPDTGLKENWWQAAAAAFTIGSAVVGLLSESSSGAAKEEQAKMTIDHANEKKDLLKRSLIDLQNVKKAGEETISAGYVTGVDNLSFGIGNQYKGLKGGYESKVGKANLVHGTADKAYEQSVDMLTEGFERKRGSLYDSFTQQMSDFDLNIQSQKDNINAQITSADHQSDLASIEEDQWYPFKYTGKVIDMFTGQYQA